MTQILNKLLVEPLDKALNPLKLFKHLSAGPGGTQLSVNSPRKVGEGGIHFLNQSSPK